MYLTGQPAAYVGPQDVALARRGIQNGYVKIKLMSLRVWAFVAQHGFFRNSIDDDRETTCPEFSLTTDENPKLAGVAWSRERIVRCIRGRWLVRRLYLCRSWRYQADDQRCSIPATSMKSIP